MNELKRNLAKYGCFILCFSIFIVNAAPFTMGAEKINKGKVIKVGVPENTYDKVNKNGKRSGYGYEYLQKISGNTGWTYEYVDCTWEDLEDKLQAGEVDIVEGVSYTKERAKNMLFSSNSMAKERYCIYAKPSTDISATDLTSFNGKNIGIFRGFSPEVILLKGVGTKI